MFIDGPLHPADAQGFNRDLRQVVSATLLAHEIRIARRIGAQKMVDAASVWAKKLGANPDNLGIGMRLPLLKAVA